MKKFIYSKFQQLWLITTIVLFITSCQASSGELFSPSNTLVIEEITPTTSSESKTTREISSNEGIQSISTEIPSTPSEMEVSQATITPSPTLDTLTEATESSVINAIIVFLARELPDDPSTTNALFSVGIFDTQSTYLEIIARPTDTLSFGQPLWSPDGGQLAFAQINSKSATYGFQVYNIANKSLTYLDAVQPQSSDTDDTIPGLFLFGWSGDGEWLAYDYTYDNIWQNPRLLYLINVFTGENRTTEIPNPENYMWFLWSPHNSDFALTNSQAIFVGNALTPQQLSTQSGDGFLGRLAWHPSQNKILVGSRGDRVLQGFNQLWQLDLDTGEWLYVGSYPHITHLAYSPDNQSILIHSQYPELNQLEIVDSNSFDSIGQIDLPSDFVLDADWMTDDMIALTTRDNILILSLDSPTEPYWILEGDSPLFESLSNTTFTDWKILDEISP